MAAKAAVFEREFFRCIESRFNQLELEMGAFLEQQKPVVGEAKAVELMCDAYEQKAEAVVEYSREFWGHLRRKYRLDPKVHYTINEAGDIVEGGRVSWNATKATV